MMSGRKRRSMDMFSLQDYDQWNSEQEVVVFPSSPPSVTL